MGREAHLLRIALGRSADENLPWSQQPVHLQRVTAPEQDDGSAASPLPVRYIGTDPSRPHSFGVQYNERGRPVNDEAREFDARLCAAQNSILELARQGILQQVNETHDRGERSTSPHSRQRSAPHAQPDPNPGDGHRAPIRHRGPPSRIQSTIIAQRGVQADWIISIWDAVTYTSSYWVMALRHQLLTFKAFSSMTLTDLVLYNYRHHGVRGLLFPGFGLTIMDGYATALGLQSDGFLEDMLSKIVQTPTTLAVYGAGALCLTVTAMLNTPISILAMLQRLHIFPRDSSFPPASWFAALSEYNLLHWPRLSMIIGPFALAILPLGRLLLYNQLRCYAELAVAADFDTQVRKHPVFSEHQYKAVRRMCKTYRRAATDWAPVVRYGQLVTLITRPLTRYLERNDLHRPLTRMTVIVGPDQYKELPAFFVARYAARIATTIAITPVDMLMHRLVARTFLKSEAAISLRGQGSPIGDLSLVFGLTEGIGGLGGLAKIILTFVLQAGIEAALVIPIVYGCQRYAATLKDWREFVEPRRPIVEDDSEDEDEAEPPEPAWVDVVEVIDDELAQAERRIEQLDNGVIFG